MLFSNCLRVVSYQNLAYTRKGIQGFAWHVNTHFQWKSFIYVLHELRRRADDGVDEAWKQVELTYENHPHFITDGLKRAVPFAVGNLTLKAWESFRTAQSDSGQDEPLFIRLLRSQRPCQGRSSSYKLVSDSTAPEEDNVNIHPDNEAPLGQLQWEGDFASSFDFSTTFDPFSPSALLPLEVDQQWEALLQTFQTQGPGTSFAPDGSF
jgi:hypothetical protein